MSKRKSDYCANEDGAKHSKFTELVDEPADRYVIEYNEKRVAARQYLKEITEIPYVFSDACVEGAKKMIVVVKKTDLFNVDLKLDPRHQEDYELHYIFNTYKRNINQYVVDNKMYNNVFEIYVIKKL